MQITCVNINILTTFQVELLLAKPNPRISVRGRYVNSIAIPELLGCYLYFCLPPPLHRSPFVELCVLYLPPPLRFH